MGMNQLLCQTELPRDMLLVTEWVQAYEPVHPYGSLLHQVASLTNTTEDCCRRGVHLKVQRPLQSSCVLVVGV